MDVTSLFYSGGTSGLESISALLQIVPKPLSKWWCSDWSPCPDSRAGFLISLPLFASHFPFPSCSSPKRRYRSLLCSDLRFYHISHYFSFLWLWTLLFFIWQIPHFLYSPSLGASVYVRLSSRVFLLIFIFPQSQALCFHIDIFSLSVDWAEEEISFISFIFYPYPLCDIENSTQGNLDGE